MPRSATATATAPAPTIAPGHTTTRRRSAAARKVPRVLRPPPGKAFGRLVAPRAGIDDIVVEGTNAADLRRGPGRDERTGLPGQRRTVAIAGHRTTYGAPFRHIDRLRRGDRITLTVPGLRLTYRVRTVTVVDPDEISVLRDRGKELLVLTACHPLHSAARRLVVTAGATGEVPAAAR
jgi:sortase A